VRRLIDRAERVALHLRAANLAKALPVEPFLLAEEQGDLVGFLAWSVRPPSQAGLGAAGLADGLTVDSWLKRLLPPSIDRLREFGVAALSYTGSAAWLADELPHHGFRLIDSIIAYEKTDLAIPHAGNEAVEVRPVKPSDMAALVALDVRDFHPRWQNSIESLQQWNEALPYFVVAVLGDTPVGYCYCSLLEPGHGHLIRMAVHPTWQGHGIGTRLLAEAIRFFGLAGVKRITLNTQARNKQSQWLYRRFGFRLVGQEAVALWRDL
jgi:ribosomal protein S18 acetylase RimI-like enzyme